MKSYLIALPILLSAFAVSAEQIEVEYKRFYSHINKIGDEETSSLQFAFGFKHVREGRLCTINSVTIETQKKDIPLTVTPEQRFLVPKEKALKLADAEVVIDLVEPANLCDMSVQLETTSDHLKTQYTHAELANLYNQYSSFFDDMGGFLSFLMPSVNGLVVHFADKSLNASLDGAPQIKNGVLTLDAKWLEQAKPLSLPQKPLRITAVAAD